jgi:hypothetical protein
MEVSGQFHAPAVYSRQNKYQDLLDTRLRGKREESLPLPGTKPETYSPWPVTGR